MNKNSSTSIKSYPPNQNQRPTRVNLLAALGALAFAVVLILVFLHGAGVSAAAPVQDDPPPEGPDELLLTDLRVRKQVDKEFAQPGEQLVYTIWYTNSLGSPVSNVVLSDTLSGGQKFDGTFQEFGITSDSFNYTGDSTDGYSLSWTFSSFPGSSSGKIIIATEVLTIPEPEIDEDIIFVGNAVEIYNNPTTVTGASDVANTMVVGPLLEIDKGASPGSTLPGHWITYWLTVTNYSRSDSIPATNLVITDDLPDNTSFLSADSGGSFDAVAQAVVWNISSLAVGSSTSVSFMVEVDPAAGPSVKNIVNAKNDYRVTSDEVKIPVTGESKVTVKLDPLLQKTASPTAVFPGEEVIYTITVYNPINAPRTGVVVTDTLPGVPFPFTYVGPTTGGPAEPVASGANLIWSDISLPAWGSQTFSFAIRVPNQTEPATYKNDLAAYHPDTYFAPNTGLAAVTVKPPVTIKKAVGPTAVLPGETVNYTITVTNDGPFLVSNIRLTDTFLGPDFEYLHMTGGPEPLPGYLPHQVVWTGLEVQPAGGSIELSFAALADGLWLVTYKNKVEGESPDAYVKPFSGAGVKILSPVGIYKTVSPSQVFVEEEFAYDIQVSNHDDEAWTFDQVGDNLPTGFEPDPWVEDLNPAVLLNPGDMWQTGFTAKATTAIDSCDALPDSKSFKNVAGAIWVHLISPEEHWAVNATAMAPVKIVPNIQTDLIPYRQVVQAGDKVTYTLHLENVSPTPATNSTLELILPVGFEYLSTLSGPSPFVNGEELTWSAITIPAHSDITIVFLVQVPEGIKDGVKKSVFSGSAASDVCFGKLGTGEHPIGNGSVTVAEDVIVLSKKAITEEVPPRALVEFQIMIQNKDYYDFVLPEVKDILPNGFDYYTMTTGPEPTVVGEDLIWQNVLVEGNSTLKWTIYLQAGPLFGKYFNKIDAYSPETVISLAKSEPPVFVRPLFDLVKFAGADHALPGTIIPYTITLVNYSDSPYTDIRITDTLPTGFTYHGMLPNYPEPISTGPDGSQPVWDGLSLGANCGGDGCFLDLVFEALIGVTVPEGYYLNEVIGYSPVGSIPGPVFMAPVTVTLDLPPPPPSSPHVYLPVIHR